VLCGIRNKKLSTLAKFIFTQPISWSVYAPC
jgi:hypothetical protein